MKKTIVSILALIMILGLILVPASAAEWPEGSCAIEITVEFVDCKPDDSVSFTFRDISSWAGAGWAPYGNQVLTFTPDNNVVDLMIPKKDLSWMFGADYADSYWIVDVPEGYTVTPQFIDGDGNDPSVKGHAKFIVTGKGNIAGEILKGTPTVDGKLDGLYKDSLKMVQGKDPVIWVPKEDNDNVEATVYFLHDGEYLYVCAIVTGDSAIVDTGAASWACDGIDVWFLLPEPNVRTKITLDAFAQPYDEDNKYIGNFENGLQVDVSKVEKAAVRDEANMSYVVEAKIPIPYYSESAGTIGINIQLNNVYDPADTGSGAYNGGFYGAQYTNPQVMALVDTAAKAPAADDTGDMIGVVVALLAVSGTAITVLKKKEF